MAKRDLSPFLQRLDWEDLDQSYLRSLIRLTREEDIQGTGLRKQPLQVGDLTTEALGLTGHGKGVLVAREPMVACGLKLANTLLEEFGEGTHFEPNAVDGEWLATGRKLGTIAGNRETILTAERSLLNFVQRLSGISTLTKRFVEALGDGKVRLLDTRKTTPGHRSLEKYAVAIGGGWNHRFGLFDRIMIKDNHLAAGNASEGHALVEAIRKAKQANPELLVQVEVDRIDQIELSLEAGVDALLLDNFSLDDLREGLRIIGGEVITEASGGITLESASRYEHLALDFISTSSLVGRSSWCDVGLDWLT